MNNIESGWSVYYCGLCGGCFLSPQQLLARDELSGGESSLYSLDETIVDESALQWLNRVRLLGRNSEIASPRKCYISGVGEATDTYEIIVDPGPDPNIPSDDLDERENFRPRCYIYKLSNPERCSIPIHETCLQFFEALLKRRMGHNSLNDPGVDIEILWQILEPHRGRYRMDNFHYFEFVPNFPTDKDKNWTPRASFEPWLTDGFNIPSLVRYASNLPRKQPVQQSTPEFCSDETFSRLPYEVLEHIFDYLPAVAMVQFMVSTRSVFEATRSATFWKRRLRLDMPYLWEIHDMTDHPKNVDWHEVYVRMHFQSYPGGWDKAKWKDRSERLQLIRNKHYIWPRRENLDLDHFEPSLLGIASRRRIFDSIQQVLAIYLLSRHEAQAPGGISNKSNSTIEKAKCTHSPTVSYIPREESTPFETVFLTQWTDILSRGNMIRWGYNRYGVLCYFCVSIKGNSYWFGRPDSISPQDPSFHEQANLQLGEWIEGFVLMIQKIEVGEAQPQFVITNVKIRTVSHEFRREISPSQILSPQRRKVEGEYNERLLVADRGKAIVGLKGHITAGHFTHFGLLEADIPSLLHLSPTPPYPDMLTRSLLWQDHIPPATVLVHPGSCLNKDEGLDVTPLKAVYFGPEYMEMNRSAKFDLSTAEVFNLSGSPKGNFLEITWQHTPKEVKRGSPEQTFHRLGDNQNNVRHFPIDGPGGERIIGIGCQSWRNGSQFSSSIKITTNRQRQIVFGAREPESRYNMVAPPRHRIAGMFSGRSPEDSSQFSVIGVLLSPDSNDDGARPDFSSLKDTSGRCWEPNPPPLDWTAFSNPTFGEAPGPADCERVTHLDLTRPIEQIKGLFAAPDWHPVLGLGGPVIVYGDCLKNVPFCCQLGEPSFHSSQAAKDPYLPALKALQALPQRRAVAQLGLSAHGSAAQNIESRRYCDFDPDAVAHADDTAAHKQNVVDDGLWPPGAASRHEKLQPEFIARIRIWSGKYLNGMQFQFASGEWSPAWGKAGGKPSADIISRDHGVLTSSTASEAASYGAMDFEAPIVVDGCVGLKFVLGMKRGDLEALDHRPIAVQALKLKSKSDLSL